MTDDEMNFIMTLYHRTVLFRKTCFDKELAKVLYRKEYIEYIVVRGHHYWVLSDVGNAIAERTIAIYKMEGIELPPLY